MKIGYVLFFLFFYIAYYNYMQLYTISYNYAND